MRGSSAMPFRVLMRETASAPAPAAAAVAVGTESFRDPAAGLRIADELEAICAAERGILEPASSAAGGPGQG